MFSHRLLSLVIPGCHFFKSNDDLFCFSHKLLMFICFLVSMLLFILIIISYYHFVDIFSSCCSHDNIVYNTVRDPFKNVSPSLAFPRATRQCV